VLSGLDTTHGVELSVRYGYTQLATPGIRLSWAQVAHAPTVQARQLGAPACTGRLPGGAALKTAWASVFFVQVTDTMGALLTGLAAPAASLYTLVIVDPGELLKLHTETLPCPMHADISCHVACRMRLTTVFCICAQMRPRLRSRL
jgi:hypothetical protein